MPQYLVCNYLPDDFDPSTVTETMMEEIHALNRELIAAGARKFACGISPAANAKTLRKQPNGKVLISHRLRCAWRGARASFLPGSGTRTRWKQVNNRATAARNTRRSAEMNEPA
jgi:hypothetical protein